MPGKGKVRLAIVSLASVTAAAAVCALSLHQPIARAQAPKPVAVSVPIEGKLARLLVKEGDLVQQGQAIAEIDTTAYEADLKKAQAELQQIQGQAQNAIKPMEAIPGMSGFL